MKDVYREIRDEFAKWEVQLEGNVFLNDEDFQHSLKYHGVDSALFDELSAFGAKVSAELEPLVKLNNLAVNLPRLENYNAIGERIDEVVHHPSYVAAGDIIYGSGLLGRLMKPSGLLECLSFLFLSSQTGEAGHNCPVACSAGIIRVLQRVKNVPHTDYFLQKLIAPSYRENFTGAQFLTEIQGGSDVGLNSTYAERDGDHWRIYGEKWFCSNANAELIFITARYDRNSVGTKGLGLFLIPAKWNEKKNAYQIRRLKDKIGTRTMATGEIDFVGAHAYQVGELEQGFHLAMSHVLHLSRIFNSICVTGMARRAYEIARLYAHYREVFGKRIEDYPLVQDNLARIKAENTALLAGVLAAIKLQDQQDKVSNQSKEIHILLRVLVNLLKYLTALWSVEHIHHAIDTLAGNGTIESFSPLPRFLRDSIVCENWEGTHNILCMQVYKDIMKYQADEIFFNFMMDEIKNLSSKDQRYFTKQVNGIINITKEFKALGSQKQLLEIRFLANHMIIVFCALMLCKEANHQGEESSKAACLALFKQLHTDALLTKKGI